MTGKGVVVTEFIYRRVIHGDGVPCLELKDHLDNMLPEHPKVFHRLMTDLGLIDWKIVFVPSRDMFKSSGYCLKRIREIIIANHLDPKEVIVTFCHEVIHVLFPSMREEQVEEMGYQWGEEFQELYR